VKTPVPVLCDASLSVAPGEIVAVVGEVGSGKSALVKALIGELTVVNQTLQDGSTQAPRVTAHGSIAYCAQEAWLSKGTIKESVVFGRDFNEEKYIRAVHVAGLDDDIASGGLSDETDVGRMDQTFQEVSVHELHLPVHCTRRVLVSTFLMTHLVHLMRQWVQRCLVVLARS